MWRSEAGPYMPIAVAGGMVFCFLILCKPS